MKHLACIVLVPVLLALACNLPSSPAAAPTPTTASPGAGVTVEPTNAAASTEAPATVAATPAAPAPTEVPQPTVAPTPVPVPSDYIVDEEATIGGYLVRQWRSTAEDSLGYDGIAEISAAGQVLAQVPFSAAVDLSGRDITGEGNPDVVIETYSGGAHCCSATFIYDLGTTLTKVLETRPSNCGGTLEDLDGDGVLEFTTCDDIFAYAYCPYAGSPMVRAILRYRPGQGYLPASPEFEALYTDDVATHTAMAQGAQAEALGEWDRTTKCSVLPLVLDHLYTGKPDQAWNALNEYYAYPDRALLWAEVVRAVSGSSLYVPAPSLPDVSFPDYYMLQLLTSCGSDQQFVGFLKQGQDPCSADVPRRDIFWLQWELQQIGLLADNELLVVAPLGCANDCRLDAVTTSDSARVGSIRLDTVSGFPGAVYRTNGQESAHWRLRGDLAWERVAP